MYVEITVLISREVDD